MGFTDNLIKGLLATSLTLIGAAGCSSDDQGYSQGQAQQGETVIINQDNSSFVEDAAATAVGVAAGTVAGNAISDKLRKKKATPNPPRYLPVSRPMSTNVGGTTYVNRPSTFGGSRSSFGGFGGSHASSFGG